MNAISNIESATKKLFHKLFSRAKSTFGSLMALTKRAQSSWKVAIGMRERAQNSWKVAIAMSARAQSSWKFASPYFTFFQATKFSSSTYNNVTIS